MILIIAGKSRTNFAPTYLIIFFFFILKTMELNQLQVVVVVFFFYIVDVYFTFTYYYFFFFAMSCGIQNLSFPTRDGTHTPCSGSSDSQTFLEKNFFICKMRKIIVPILEHSYED